MLYYYTLLKFKKNIKLSNAHFLIDIHLCKTLSQLLYIHFCSRVELVSRGTKENIIKIKKVTGQPSKLLFTLNRTLKLHINSNSLYV